MQHVSDLVLPKGVRELIVHVPVEARHPGLQLDKYSRPAPQEKAGAALDDVCRAKASASILSALRRRRQQMLDALGAQRIEARTEGTLTLHLARASGLENAGIHLHPVYGFCCLPGSGIKGMVRAFAETIWRAEGNDPEREDERIRAVFGSGGTESDEATTGAVVFHDAWPLEQPPLIRDIANNHHVKYYEGKDDPGDWGEPNPVSFLAVPAGVPFDFALSLRSRDGDADLLDLAGEWLVRALTHEGFGAKTNAGYGRFHVSNRPRPAAPRNARSISEHELTLAAPAFLAGARQEREDCELRPATLRGLLRWWWRTMHAGHLNRKDLLRLEEAIWGSAERGAAVALSLAGVRGAVSAPERFAYRDRFRLQAAFAREHGIKPVQGRTVQGLFYASYGMDEKNRQRWAMPPGAKWRLTLSARRGQLDRGEIPARKVLRQAEAALWLLCRYGAVGAKARKGFGSFHDLRDSDVPWIASFETCVAEASQLRDALNLRSGGGVGSPKLESLRDKELTLEQATEWTDAWYALDQIGAAYQEIVKSFKPPAGGPAHSSHAARRGPRTADPRVALGLPRRNARVKDINRHSSPLQWSLSPNAKGKFTVRLTAFPSPKLPSLEASRKTLREAVKGARETLEKRAAVTPRPSRGPGPGGGFGGGAASQRRPHSAPRTRVPGHQPPERKSDLPKPGDRVEAVLLDEKTKKGGWKFRHEATGLVGSIQNTKQVPATCKPGQRVQVIVAYARPGDMACKWPTADSNDPTPSKGKPRNRTGRPRR